MREPKNRSLDSSPRPEQVGKWYIRAYNEMLEPTSWFDFGGEECTFDEEQEAESAAFRFAAYLDFRAGEQDQIFLISPQGFGMRVA